MRRLLSLMVAVGSCLVIASPTSASITEIEFLGQARVSGDLRVDETPVGGLSGITFDATRNLFYVVSDDPSARAPARFYTMRVDLTDDRLAEDGVQVIGVTSIQSPDGGPMPGMTLDPEGMALHPDGSLYISSEGQIKRQQAPFVRQYSLSGEYLNELELPDRYRPSSDGLRGPRHNLVFESLTLTPEGDFLFFAPENALVQDGPESTLEGPSPNRLVKYDLASARIAAEYVYMAEPVAKPSSIPDGLEVSGLVELLALDDRHLLAMERSYSMGVGNSIKIFLVSFEGATDVQTHKSLAKIDLSTVTPVSKHLVLDLEELGIYLDNLEGMTLGPPLPDGRRTLILVSDNNFSPLIQTTQIFAFALGERELGVEAVQGASHRSPLEGRWVRGVEGVVTAPFPGREPGFWIEAKTEDGDPSTSRGLLIIPGEDLPAVSPGDGVIIDGRVVERQRSGHLSVTAIEASSVRVSGTGVPLPPPFRVGQGGARVPSEVVDNDSLQIFEPAEDGVDFWESLEGMRVTLRSPRVVGPTNSYDDFVVDASDNSSSVGRTGVGGLLMRPGDLNPERLTVDCSALNGVPNIDTGHRIDGDLMGVLGYGFAGYRLYVQDPLPRIDGTSLARDATELVPLPGRLTIATFNVHNLSAQSQERHFEALANELAVSLGGPDIVALQEIQDDTGPLDDGTVSAAATLERLISLVTEMGGPEYEFRQIDPLDNRDGGRPGSNIRPAFLFNPNRVHFVDKGDAGALDDVELVEGPSGVELSVSPGRIGATAPAFNKDETRSFSGTRKPLVGQFEFADRRLIVVNNHWSSKGDDDRVFGDVQPPIWRSEDQRSQQARLVAEFVSQVVDLEPTAAVVVIGDFNDHEYRTPLRILEAGTLENLVYQLTPDDRYSYNFKGNSQTLDHILVNRTLLDGARVRLDIVHLNSDIAHQRRSSDHDPLVVELDFSPDN